jgi:phosphoglycolate phosphatase
VHRPTPLHTIRAAIFDFDFTLADSSNGIFDCANTALAAMGIAPVDREAVNATIGLSLRESFTRLTGEATPERREDFVRHFHLRADKVMVSSAVIYDFVPEALRELRARGITLAVASTKRRIHIESILEREKIADVFAAIIGGSDVQNQKPHPESLLAAMSQLKVLAEGCVYIGDSVVDAEAAQRAGIDFIAVLTGVTSRADFSAFPQLATLNHAGELPPWLESNGGGAAFRRLS